MWLTTALVVIATMLGSEKLGADPEVPTERLLYYNLVETVVTAATNQDGWSAGTFQVTRVFKGDPGIQGKTFEFASGGGSTHGRPTFGRPLEAGEKAIWLLRKDGESVTWVGFGPRMKRTSLVIVRLPVREGDKPTLPHEPSHAQVLEWALTVEATVKAKPTERYAILRKHAESLSRPMAYWALAVLAEVDPEGSKPFFREMLARKDLPEWKRYGLERILFDLTDGGRRNPKQLEPPLD